MENNEMQKQEQTQKPKSQRGLLILLVLLIIALTAGIIVILSMNKQQKKEYTQEIAYVEEEKKSLQKELNDIIGEYDALKTNNDSLNMQLSSQQEKIKRLLKERASNVDLIRKYKAELGTLREVLKSYIAQVDSLNTRNQQLVQENTEVKNKLEQARNENIESSKKIDELNSAVQKGSIISTSNIVTTLLNKRGKEENNASKITKVKVCFTMRENKLAPAGSKDVYLRIMDPNGSVIAYSETDVFDFEGQQVVYSAKRQIEYEQKDIDLCIFWDNNSQLQVATYTVDIFADGHLIGTTTFSIKKK
jgi:predicted  nucleic acid-binding Zn-ribbon protein